MGVYYLVVVLGIVVLATNADADRQSICFVCVNQTRCDDASGQCAGVENCELLSNLCILECTPISAQCRTCTLCPTTTEGRVAASQELVEELFDSVLFSTNISVVRSARLFLSLAAAIGPDNVTNTSVSNFGAFMHFHEVSIPAKNHILIYFLGGGGGGGGILFGEVSIPPPK